MGLRKVDVKYGDYGVFGFDTRLRRIRRKRVRALMQFNGYKSFTFTIYNLSTTENGQHPHGGAEDGDLIDGPDDAQQANLNTAPVMGEWSTDVRTPTLPPLDESLTLLD
ncbi:hypothetical protein KIN20_009838 [Parelaphostrongylus tenuis]|uniref:Uncharacterized protein n=1 Tax=Parelaphostrongylus tenuis TaxID=148309 RepID=A0AAD5QKX7_PARTN|nr:hypothetical protein KIN20_009838 [Parelaphostrongylus tenuis]